jgi:hypothetical protein
MWGLGAVAAAFWDLDRCADTVIAKLRLSKHSMVTNKKQLCVLPGVKMLGEGLLQPPHCWRASSVVFASSFLLITLWCLAQ